jgi:putative nucleotidyltransferase with HDIG domain
MNREDAYQLVCEFTHSDGLQKHMLAVEAAMRAYAGRFGQGEEKWGIVGLLHDFDYERWPDPPDHPLRGAAILAERGYPEDVIYAIKSHADYLPDCPRVSLLDKALYACDELAGFCTAVALVRPTGLDGLTARTRRTLRGNVPSHLIVAAGILFLIAQPPEELRPRVALLARRLFVGLKSRIDPGLVCICEHPSRLR